MWMTPNFLLQNSDKTEVIVLGPELFRNELCNDYVMIVALGGLTLASSITVKNLTVTFDQDMSLNSHKHLPRTAFFIFVAQI